MNTILTVSAVNTYISFKLKSDPKLKGIAISGEITDLTINHTSGHMYFSLTDGNSTVKAVMFSTMAQRLRFVPQNGLSVVAFGNVEVYERNGVYQLLVSQLLPNGKGAEYLSLLELKAELEKQGIFNKPKKSIPKYPNKIAVVSSQSGAAIHDINNVINRRYPFAKLELFSATVQGQSAPESIANAITLADESGVDVIILSRGGGSDADLSCFNSKPAVMAVYACKTPVISAVGHEIDYSLCDIVADLRAPTPSAAAELATPDIIEIEDKITSLKQDISRAIISRINTQEIKVKSLCAILESNSPIKIIQKNESQANLLQTLLNNSYSNYLARREQLINSLNAIIESCNYMNVLKRGYATVSIDGKTVMNLSSLNIGDNVSIKFSDGTAIAEIKSIGE